jgi:cellobiose phosphorylase
MIILLVHHIIGIRPQFDHLLVCPKLLPGIEQVKGSFPVRDVRLNIEIHRKSRQKGVLVQSNCEVIETSEEQVSLKYSQNRMDVSITLPDG